MATKESVLLQLQKVLAALHAQNKLYALEISPEKIIHEELFNTDIDVDKIITKVEAISKKIGIIDRLICQCQQLVALVKTYGTHKNSQIIKEQIDRIRDMLTK